jgi:CelD/BcsL family acetyltransferase involved in cellulose biosynthesis
MIIASSNVAAGPSLVPALRLTPVVPSLERSVPRSFLARLHTNLQAVKPLWQAMQRDGTCTAYQRFDWVSTIARHLVPRRGAEPLIVEVIDAVTQRPVMLLPLIHYRRPSHKVIEWLSCGVCDYTAPLLAPGLALTAKEAAAAWAAVRSVLPPADMLRVRGIPRHVFGVANPLANLAQARRSSLVSTGIALDGDPETLLQRKCNPAFVRDFGKASRRLERRGELRFVEAQTPAEVDEIFAALLAQRLARFRKLGRFDLLTQPAAVAFHRDAAMQGLKGGPVRLFGLRVGDEWVATCYVLVHHGALQGLLLAMAEDSWRRCTPGLQIVARTMIWASQQGLDYYDMSVGSLHYKKDIGGREMPLFEIDEALTLRGRILLAGLRQADAGKAWLQAHPRTFEQLRAGRRTLRRTKQRLEALLSGKEARL